MDPINKINRESSSRLHMHYSKSRKSNDIPIELSWHNICMSVYSKLPQKSLLSDKLYKEKKILKNLCGKVHSKQLVAIIGPTGCGKTSFLNVLAARAPSSGSELVKIEGSVKINNTIRSENSARSMTAYVTQDDNLYPHMTVKETLMLTAQFFMPSDTCLEDMEDLVDDIIMELGLINAANTMIGSHRVRGVSGGERKRASIGVQLISDPSMLFLDEPTSGLDGFQALSVMETMKSLSLNNRIVITVIHQPRSSIYSMIDQLIILSEGMCIYHGNAQEAVDYFSALGHICPPNFNPADFFIDLMSPDHRSSELSAISLSRIQNFGDHWQNRNQIVDSLSVNKSVNDVSLFPHNNNHKNIIDYMKKSVRVFGLLCWRSFTESKRDIPTITIRFFFSTLFCLFIGGLFNNVGDDQKSIRDRIGFFFFISINQGYPAFFNAMPIITRERWIVHPEISGQAYSFLLYYLSKFVTEIPFTVGPAAVFGCVVYWLVGLNPSASHFGIFMLILFLETISSMSLGLMVSAFFPSVEAASAFGTPLLTIIILLSGYYISLQSLPIVADWIPYACFIRWSFEAFMINEFHDAHMTCTQEDIEVGSCITDGGDVLSDSSFGASSVWVPIIYQVILTIAQLVLGYIFLISTRVTYIGIGHKGRLVATAEKNLAVPQEKNADTSPADLPHSSPEVSAKDNQIMAPVEIDANSTNRNSL